MQPNTHPRATYDIIIRRCALRERALPEIGLPAAIFVIGPPPPSKHLETGAVARRTGGAQFLSTRTTGVVLAARS